MYTFEECKSLGTINGWVYLPDDKRAENERITNCGHPTTTRQVGTFTEYVYCKECGWKFEVYTGD